MSELTSNIVDKLYHNFYKIIYLVLLVFLLITVLKTEQKKKPVITKVDNPLQLVERSNY